MKLLSMLCAGLMFVSVAWAEEFNSDVETKLKPWTHLNALNDPDAFQFAIVTDRTGGHRAGVFMEGVRKLNLLQPEFVMSVGDLIEGYTEDLERIDREWKEFNSFVDALEMPFFYLPGNHDISNQVMREEWDKRFGRSYYHFVYKDVLFLCLNTEDPPSTQITKEQSDYAVKVVEDHPDVRWTMVFMHKPMWKYGKPGSGWEPIQESLKGRPHSVFAGHTHHYYKSEVQESDYIVLATLGGGSGLRGQNFGEFDHFMWVTMTPEGPRLANLMLSGIWDKNVITDERMALIRPVLAGRAVRTDGVVVDTENFDKATATMRLTNDGDVPMKVDVFMLQDDILRSTKRRIIETVAPNSVELIEFELFAAEKINPKDLPPLKAQWTVTYEKEGDLTPINLRGQHRIVVDSAYTIASAPKVKIDGTLEEWGELKINPKEPGQIETTTDSWWGNQDGSMELSVAYDNEYLYVAADITDDIRRINPNEEDYWKNDCVVLYLDARLADERGRGKVYTDYLMVPVVPGQKTEDIFQRESLPEGLQVVSDSRRDGVSIEFAVPISYLNEKQGADWKDLRLNLSLIDHDSDGQATVWFRPGWGKSADYVASGTFVRK